MVFIARVPVCDWNIPTSSRASSDSGGLSLVRLWRHRAGPNERLHSAAVWLEWDPSSVLGQGPHLCTSTSVASALWLPVVSCQLPPSSAGHEQPEVWSHPTTLSARCHHHGLQSTSAERDVRGPSTRGREGACPLLLPDATHPPCSEGSSLLLPRIPRSCSCSFQWGNSAHSYPGLQECKQPVLHVFELQPRCSTCAANRSPLLAEAPLRASAAWCSLPWVPPALVLLQLRAPAPSPLCPALHRHLCHRRVQPGAGRAAQRILNRRSLLRGCLNRGNCFTL